MIFKNPVTSNKIGTGRFGNRFLLSKIIFHGHQSNKKNGVKDIDPAPFKSNIVLKNFGKSKQVEISKCYIVFIDCYIINSFYFSEI